MDNKIINSLIRQAAGYRPAQPATQGESAQQILPTAHAGAGTSSLPQVPPNMNQLINAAFHRALSRGAETEITVINEREI